MDKLPCCVFCFLPIESLLRREEEEEDEKRQEVASSK